MNLNDVSTQLLFTTAPIWVQKKDKSSDFGTSFIYSLPSSENASSTIPFLVTNEHVLRDGERAVVDLVRAKSGKPDLGNRIRVEISKSVMNAFQDQENDLSLIPLGAALNELHDAGTPIFFRSVDPSIVPDEEKRSELSAMEDITFIGYPSALYDEKNTLPLIRTGITASPVWSDFQGEPAFVVDAGVYPGSSGSPVFILNQGAYTTREGLTFGNRILFLGVMTGSYRRPEKGADSVYLGLGRVCRSDVLHSFAERALKEML